MGDEGSECKITVSGLGLWGFRMRLGFGDYEMGCRLTVQGFGELGIRVSSVGLDGGLGV